MLRIISTGLNQALVTILTDDFNIKDFVITPISSKEKTIQIGDILIGRITNIVKNIESIFLEISPGVEGYLKYDKDSNFIYTNGKTSGKPSISDTILVQVTKEPTKSKSYTLDHHFTFMNRHFVLKSQLNRVHLSSKYKEEENYKEIKEHFSSLGEEFLKQTGLGFIVRKSAMTLSEKEFKKSLTDLYQTYQTVLHRGGHGIQYEKIYKDLSPHLKLLRDHHDEVEKIMTDDENIFSSYRSYLEIEKSPLKDKLFFYEDEKMKLSNLYSIGSNLERVLSKKVRLDSGAYLIIEPTEALTVIDVNSGKAIAGKSLKQDTFLKINLEAAKEIARQIRLRNLSGIIIIDFIDSSPKHYKTLMQAMKENLKEDNITTSVEDMTKLGLMEITRRRVGKPLHEYKDILI